MALLRNVLPKVFDRYTFLFPNKSNTVFAPERVRLFCFCADGVDGIKTSRFQKKRGQRGGCLRDPGKRDVWQQARFKRAGRSLMVKSSSVQRQRSLGYTRRNTSEARV